MSQPLYIDVATGEGRVSLSGPIRQRLKLFLNDLVPLRIAFILNGAIVSGSVLESGNATLKVGIRAKAGQGDVLAFANSYTMDGDEAVVVLPMDEPELSAWFAANVPDDQEEATLRLEVEVTNQAGTQRQTLYQSACVVARQVNE